MIPDLRGLRLTQRQRRRYEEMRDAFIGEAPELIPALQPPVRCFADLPAQPQEWLWPGRIPCGALTLICGEQGRGKSLLTLDLAARVSAGRPWPHGGPPAAPADVLIFSAEDSLSRSVRNRLLAAGADLDRVHYIDTAHWSNGPYIPADRPPARDVKTPFGRLPRPSWDSLPRDMRHLRGALAALPECRLVIIDPFTAYLDQVDLFWDEPEEIRVALAPLTILADQANAAILAVVHRDGQQRLHSGQKRNGLRTLAGMARAAYLVDRVGAAPYGSALIPVKNNHGDATTMAPFNVKAADNGVSLMEWSPTALPLPVVGRGSSVPALEQVRAMTSVERAVAWLAQHLADGPIPSRDLASRARSAGFKRKAYEQARARLGVIATRAGAIGAPWVSSLPATPGQKCRDRLSTCEVETVASVISVDSQIPEVFPSTPPAKPSTIP